MVTRLLACVRHTARRFAQALGRRLAAVTASAASPLVGGTLADLVRGKPALIAENALLRQQIIILRRSVKRPRCTPSDRTLLVLLASRVRLWRQALLIVQPETLLRWHRQGFRLFWRRRSQAATAPRKAKVSAETIALIRYYGLQATCILARRLEIICREGGAKREKGARGAAAVESAGSGGGARRAGARGAAGHGDHAGLWTAR